MALSPALLASSDSWKRPLGLPGKQVQRAAPALIEERCAGHASDELTLEVRLARHSLYALALRRALLDEIRAAAGEISFRLITSIPAAVAQVFGECAFTSGGERIEIYLEEGDLRWRCYPVDGPDSQGGLRWRGQEIEYAFVPAVAAAACDPDKVPNLARQLPGAGRSLLSRLRDPIVNTAAAAALLLGALGFHFHREAEREMSALLAARGAAQEVAARLLPGQAVAQGSLLGDLGKRLAEVGGGSAEPGPPSALAFWREIGLHYPDPDTLGLSLESLDLSPEGGRLSARVPAAKDDPLKNASQVEGQLSRSKKLRTRGDYTVRENQVQVRLRMDFSP